MTSHTKSNDCRHKMEELNSTAFPLKFILPDVNFLRQHRIFLNKQTTNLQKKDKHFHNNEKSIYHVYTIFLSHGVD